MSESASGGGDRCAGWMIRPTMIATVLQLPMVVADVMAGQRRT